jgi:hypothetical protein
MGVVRRAEHKVMGQPAVKVVSRVFVNSPDDVERSRRCSG